MSSDHVEHFDARLPRRTGWGRRVGVVVIVSAVIVLYAAFFGDTRWRVWLNQKVWIPPSAEGLRCGGHTLAWLGDTDSDSNAEFMLPTGELDGFLAQFKDGVEHSSPSPALQPRPDGILVAASPTGIDHVYVYYWRQPGGGRVRIVINTSWN